MRDYARALWDTSNMPVFLVTPLAHNATQLGEAVRAKMQPEQRFELQGRGGWLVTFKGTSVELSGLLCITSTDPDVKPTIGSAMVTTVGSYYGLASTTMWEWLKTRFESQR